MHYSSGTLVTSTFLAPRGSASGLLRPSKRFVCNSYCGVAERDGVFAHPGNMSAILPLPAQAASAIPKNDNMTRRVIMNVRSQMLKMHMQSGQIRASLQ
jgi:hypothetical protein